MKDATELLPEAIQKHGGTMKQEDLGWGYYYVLINSKTKYRGFIRLRKEHGRETLPQSASTLLDLFNDYYFFHDIAKVSKRKKYA